MGKVNALREQTAEQIIDDLEAGLIDGEQAGPALERLGYDLDMIWEAVYFAIERRELASCPN